MSRSMSMTGRVSALLWGIGASVGVALGQVPETAPVESATPLFADAIGAERRAHAAEVWRARAEGDPFQPSGVWLPPFYLADAERSVEWIGLLYVDTVDYDEGSRARLLAPFYLSLASPEERTLITPLFGGREDAAGEVGYAGNYVWRRDELADSDVVFPFFWSFRERDFAGGPDARSAGAAAPFVFWRRRTSGDHWTIAPPLFWRWGDAHETTTIAGPVFSVDEPDHSVFGALPLYLGRRDGEESGFDACLPLLLLRQFDAESHRILSPLALSWSDRESSTTIVPPALFVRHEDAEGTSTFALNTYYGTRPGGSTLVSFPLVWRRTDPGESDTGVLPLYVGGERDEGRSRYDVVPPLVFAHASQEETGTSQTLLLNTYYAARPDGYTLASVPLAFARREGEEETIVVPPLLTYHDREGETSRTFALNTYVHLTPDTWDVAVLPLVFAGGDAAAETNHVVAFPLLWHFADADSSVTVAPPLLYRFADVDGTRLTVLPLFDYSSDATRTRVISPFMYHHADADTVEDASSKTVVLGLYWDFRGPDLHTRVAFPLWWQHEDTATGRGLSTLFPLYWRRQGVDETTHVLFNVAWTNQHDGPGWSFHLFPLIDLASDAPDHSRWQVAGGLLGRESHGARHRWRFFYNWTEPSEGP